MKKEIYERFLQYRYRNWSTDYYEEALKASGYKNDTLLSRVLLSLIYVLIVVLSIWAIISVGTLCLEGDFYLPLALVLGSLLFVMFSLILFLLTTFLYFVGYLIVSWILWLIGKESFELVDLEETWENMKKHFERLRFEFDYKFGEWEKGCQ